MAGKTSRVVAIIVAVLAVAAILVFAFYPMLPGGPGEPDLPETPAGQQAPEPEPDHAVSGAWVEGRHYQQVPEPEPLPEDGTIEVIEVFWYGCPACYSLESHIRSWSASLPEDVRFTRVAASMNPGWEIHARAFYTAEVLGVTDAVHPAMFDAIHSRGNRLQDAQALAALFAEHGVEEEEFHDTFDSFAVETRLRRAERTARRYRLTGVPSIVVAGRYKTDASSAGGYGALIELVDHLVERVREQ